MNKKLIMTSIALLAIVMGLGSVTSTAFAGGEIDPCDGFGGDSDGDGVCNDNDNCVDVANAGQENNYGTSLGDACEDTDTDGVVDQDDPAPEDPCIPDDSGALCDSDGDSILNGVDNCVDVANLGQEDKDLDGFGDACDDNDDRIPDCNEMDSTIWYDENSSTNWSYLDADGTTILDWLNVTFDDPGYTVSGTIGDDVIYGSPEADVIKAAWGDDTVCGNDGTDTLHGSFGEDWLDGGADADLIQGGHHADKLLCGGDETGDDAQDTAKGGWGLDTFENCDEEDPEFDVVEQGKTVDHKKYS